jgi:hypothetical protein
MAGLWALPHSSQKLPSAGGLCTSVNTHTSRLSFQITTIKTPLTLACYATLFQFLCLIVKAPAFLYNSDDGGSKDLWNLGKLLSEYRALQPRRQPSLYSPPWEPQILLILFSKNLTYRDSWHSSSKSHVHFPLLTSFQKIHPSLRPCATFCSLLVFYGGQFLAPTQPLSWRITPCQLSTTTCSIYSQLPSISGRVLFHPQPLDMPCTAMVVFSNITWLKYYPLMHDKTIWDLQILQTLYDFAKILKLLISWCGLCNFIILHFTMSLHSPNT